MEIERENFKILNVNLLLLNERKRNYRKREKENDPEACKVAQNEWKNRSRSRKKNEDPEKVLVQ